MKLRQGFGILLFVSFIFSCAKKAEELPVATVDVFTKAAIAKNWLSNCEVGTEPITANDHYKVELSLAAGGSFVSQMIWYSGTCSPPNARIYYTLYGTYTLGDFVPGSSTMKTLNFTIDLVNYNGSDLMTVQAATRTAFNNDCGMTSPFFGGANATDGGHVDTSMMNCMHEIFPNSGANKTFSNIATYDGTNFYIGAHNQANIPGAFASGTVATSATIYLHE